MTALSRDSLLAVYNRFTGLVEKLPGGLQKPILRELTPIRELFLEQRPPRVLIVGGSRRSVLEVLEGFGAKDLQTCGADNGWRTYRVESRGDIEIFDARADVPDEPLALAIARKLPDVILFLEEEETGEAAWKQSAARCEGLASPLIGITFPGVSSFRLLARLSADAVFSKRAPRVLADSDPACVEAICAALPLAAQLEFARLTNARRAQAHIAGSLLKSFSAVCGVIGVQPIPLADMPILTTLQTLMVGMIIHTTGRAFTVRLVLEFLGALGFNIGAGLAMREGARALLKIIPIWGNAVSGFIAGAGTYAIGRAAIAYFIEETPISETRKIFRRLLPRWKKRPAPPALPE